LVYLQFTKPRPRNARSELYIALEMMEEILDHDLDAHEQNEIKNRLTFVIDQGESPEFIRLAEDLLTYFNEEQIALAPSPSGRLQDLTVRLQEIEIKYLNRDHLRTLLILGLGILGLLSVLIPALSLINLPLTPGREPVLEPYWYIALQVVQMLTGLLLIFGAGMIMKGSESKGFRVSYITLLVYLTIVDLYLFYYYQFATILAAIFQFALLLAVLHYQHSYLSEQNKDHQSIS
jgi:hypothetical protein